MDTRPFAGKTLLVVDDDLAMRLLLRAIFQRMGATVLLAEDGMAAQPLLGQHPDLIVLDLMMPWRNGFEVLEELRATNPPLLARTLVLTAANQQVDALLGSVPVLHKPFDMAALVELLASRLTASVPTLGPTWEQRYPSLRTPPERVAAWHQRQRQSDDDRRREQRAWEERERRAGRRRQRRRRLRRQKTPPAPARSKKRTGFALMNLSQRRSIASKGGRAAHAKGTAHEFTIDEARIAGRKGGAVVSQDRAHMAAIGRRGNRTQRRLRSQKPPKDDTE